MIDPRKIEDLKKIADQQIKNAERYAVARRIAGEAEVGLNILLVTKLAEIREEKKGVGVEMAQLMLCEHDLVARGLLKEWKENEAIYKGLEKLLDATGAKLIFEQSILKHIKEGEKWGH